MIRPQPVDVLYFFSFVNAYEVSLNGLNVRRLLEALGRHINGGAYNRMYFLFTGRWMGLYIFSRGGWGLKVGAYKMDFKVYILKVEELSCVTPRNLRLIILMRAPFFHSLVCKTVKFTAKS